MDVLINAWNFFNFITDPVVIEAGVILGALAAAVFAPETVTLWK